MSLSIPTAAGLASLLLLGKTVFAEPTGICRDSVCSDCPGAITEEGTGYPACVTYDTDKVLSGAGGGFDGNFVNFDLAPQDDSCRIIVRSPAGNDFDECGTARISSKGNQCLGVTLDTTFLIQFCCGTGDCAAAGVQKRGVRGNTNLLESKDYTFTSHVLRDTSGDVLEPLSVAMPKELGGEDKWESFVFDLGLSNVFAKRNSSDTPLTIEVGSDRSIKVRDSAVTSKKETVKAAPAIEKRASCSYTESAQGTKTGTQSYKLSGDYCDPSSYMQTNSQSISRTTSFSTTVGDPFGIVSASVGFETTETTEQSYAYEVPSREGYCGFAQWTPYFVCSRGTISCDDGHTEDGEVCTAQKVGTNDDQIGGSYDFIETRPI